MKNNGEATDNLHVGFAGAGFNGFSGEVRYFVGYYDVTALVNGPGRVYEDVPAGEIRNLAVQSRAGSEAPGAYAQASVRVSSDAAPELTDIVQVGVLVP